MSSETAATQLAHAAALHAQGRMEDAYKAYLAIAQSHPRFAPAHVGLGTVLYDVVQLEMAAAAFRAAIQIDPNDAETHFKLGNTLKEQGNFAPAIAAYEAAIRAKPDLFAAWQRMIYCHSFSQLVSPQEQLAIARQYDAAVRKGRLVSRIDVHGPDAQGRLRIGVLSAEIGAHGVGYFLESYLKNYDRAKIHLTIYSTAVRKEPQHAALRGLADASRDVHHLSDDALRDAIMADGIDVLIETTSHMLHSRLSMLALRCAPVQCHYIGYHGSSGVEAMDYFIGNAGVTPPEIDDHFSEKVWRLPRLWLAYSPPPDLPTPQPRAVTEPLVLGSFNNLGKSQDACLDVWIKVLQAVPEATLMLKDAFDLDDYSKKRVAATLRRHGIGAERVIFGGRVDKWRDHMEQYNKIDIALDTFPLNSCTTGFDALLMGTPLVALEGTWMGGRMSTTILKALGRPEWCARNADDYVALIQRMAADKAALRRHKTTLRQEVLTSELCDGVSMARALDAAFQEMVALKTRA